MPSRAELVARANVLGIDTTTAKMANDSALEQRVLWNEKRATAITGTIATTTLTSSGTAVTDGDTFTLRTKVYTAKTALTETAATGTVTSDATAPSDGDIIQIDGVAYVARTALSSPAVTNEVLIGVSAAVFLDNLKSAINLDGTPAVYSSNQVIHPTVTATTNGNTTQVVAAKKVGTAGNLITTSETSAHLSWGGASLSGGANPVENEVLIGSTADGSAFLTNAKAAINGAAGAGTTYSSNTSASKHAIVTTATPTTTLVINSTEFGIGGTDIATTETSSQLSFTSTTMAAGVAKVITPAASSDYISGDSETLV